MLSSLSCWNLIAQASPVVIKNIPTGRRAPFQHPVRADVTLEQHLLSDKLEDGMKELIEAFPVEVDNTGNLWDCDQYAVSLVAWQLAWGVERQVIPRWGRDPHGLSPVVRAGS